MSAATATSPIDTFRRLAEKPVARYAVLVAGILACIGLMIPVLPFLSSARGVAGPTATDAMHPAMAAMALVLGSAACCAVACVVGRIVNAAVGLFVLGCGLAIVSGRSGTIIDAAFGGDTLLPIALQTLGWAAAVLVMSSVVFRVSGPLPDMPALNEMSGMAAVSHYRARFGRGAVPFALIAVVMKWVLSKTEGDDPSSGGGRRVGTSFFWEVFNADAFRGLAAGLFALLIMWALCRTELKGQAIGSAVCGGVLTGMFGRWFGGRSQPILLMAAPVLAVGIAQLWTALTFQGALDLAVAQRTLPGWSVAMPIDIAAGAMLGVPIGLGWTKPTEDEDILSGD